jgi:sugar phosphate isomerase/epimerase
VSQVTTLPHPFADDLSGYAGGGCTAMEVWLTKLERHLETTSVEDTKVRLADLGVTLPAAAYQGGLLLSQGEARRAAFDLLKRRLDLCQTFGVRTLVLVADFAAPVDQTSLGRAVVSLAEAGRWAAGFGVTLALEFRGTDTFCTSLDTAVALVNQCGEANVGVCLDVFHFYKGPSKTEDLDLLTAANLAHVQVCDVAGVPRELMTDADRVFPGEGDFRLDPVVAKLKQIGYAGAVSLELMNPVLWKAKPAQVAEFGIGAVRRLLS